MHPDELLRQIRDLLQQYLDMGDQTPVAPEAQALADSIDSAMGTAGPAQGSPLGDLMQDQPPDGGGLPPEHNPTGHDGPMPQVPVENTMGGNQEPPPNVNAKSYKDANGSALDRLKKRNKDQGR
jgi:hypothetical protein